MLLSVDTLSSHAVVTAVAYIPMLAGSTSPASGYAKGPGHHHTRRGVRRSMKVDWHLGVMMTCQLNNSAMAWRSNE